MARLFALLPPFLRRRAPAAGWWIVKRLPSRAASWVMARILSELYDEVQAGRGTADTEFMELFFEPGVEWIPPATFPDAKHYHGHAGVHEEVEGFLAVWGAIGTEIRRVAVDPATDTMRVEVTHTARGKASGAGTTFDETHLFRVRRGRVYRVEMFVDR